MSNRTILVIGYGSLLSGFGLLAERRGGKSRLVARDAWPVVLSNAARGLAKPSSHGDYLAMDLEPIDPTQPIAARVGRDEGAPGEIGALLLEFDREWGALIARREEYGSEAFMRLLEMADRAGKPVGEYLLPVAENAAFNLDGYRRELRAMLGYTSPGYIFHPVPLDNGRAAIVAIGSGYHFSSDESIISRRRESGMEKLLTLAEAIRVDRLPIDREGQVGYFTECVLGGMHGLAVGDLMAGYDVGAEWGHELAQSVWRASERERANFLAATSLDDATYLHRFGGDFSPALTPLLSLAAIR